MASILERLQTALIDPGLNRRRFMVRAVQASAAVAAVAAGAGQVKKAAASNVQCCNLAFPGNVQNGCSCGVSWSWNCTQDPPDCRVWECGECYACSTSVLRLVCHCC